MCSRNDSFNFVVDHSVKSKEITLPLTFFHEGKGLTLLTQLAFSFVTVMLVKKVSALRTLMGTNMEHSVLDLTQSHATTDRKTATRYS